MINDAYSSDISTWQVFSLRFSLIFQNLISLVSVVLSTPFVLYEHVNRRPNTVIENINKIQQLNADALKKYQEKYCLNLQEKQETESSFVSSSKYSYNNQHERKTNNILRYSVITLAATVASAGAALMSFCLFRYINKRLTNNNQSTNDIKKSSQQEISHTTIDIFPKPNNKYVSDFNIDCIDDNNLSFENTSAYRAVSKISESTAAFKLVADLESQLVRNKAVCAFHQNVIINAKNALQQGKMNDISSNTFNREQYDARYKHHMNLLKELYRQNTYTGNVSLTSNDEKTKTIQDSIDKVIASYADNTFYSSSSSNPATKQQDIEHFKMFREITDITSKQPHENDIFRYINVLMERENNMIVQTIKDQLNVLERDKPLAQNFLSLSNNLLRNEIFFSNDNSEGKLYLSLPIKACLVTIQNVLQKIKFN